MSTTLFSSASALNEHGHDLSFYLDPPDELDARAELTITPLAPLSMVASQPGTYFLSEAAPTEHMILGMLENALGWHFHDDLRRELRKELSKLAKKRLPRNSDLKSSDWAKGKLPSSGSGYESILAHHVRLSPRQLPRPTLSYDDLWSMHLHDKGGNFLGGSRAYDAAIEALMTAARSSDENVRVEFGDRKGFERMSLAEAIGTRGAKIHVDSIREAFPLYYVSPKKRAYVEFDGGDAEGGPEGDPEASTPVFRYEVATTAALAEVLAQAVDDPAGPLYLGSNDGWVDAKWTAQ